MVINSHTGQKLLQSVEVASSREQDKYCEKAVESAYFTKLTDKKNELGYDMNYLLARPVCHLVN